MICIDDNFPQLDCIETKKALIGPEDVRWKRDEEAHRVSVIVSAATSVFSVFFSWVLPSQRQLVRKTREVFRFQEWSSYSLHIARIPSRYEIPASQRGHDILEAISDTNAL